MLLGTKSATRIERRVFAPDETLHAPYFIDIEVVQVLRRYCASGELDSDRERVALEDLNDFPITRYPHDILLPRIWEPRQNMTAYDATYPTFRTFGIQYRATQSGDGMKHGIRQPHEVKNLSVEVTELWLEELDLTIGFE